jgi:hypothetical protein
MTVETTKLAVSEAFDFVPETLPTCPDGSGDLWWDDASYIRYQSWDPYFPPDDLYALKLTLPSERYAGSSPEAGALELFSPNFRWDHRPGSAAAALPFDGEEPPF